MGLGSRILSTKVKGSGPECPHVLGGTSTRAPCVRGGFWACAAAAQCLRLRRHGGTCRHAGSRLRSAPAGALYLDEVRET